MVKKALVIIVSIFVIPIFTNITLADNADVTIKGVISNPKYYDGKRITVEGKVEKVHHTTSFSGDPYTLFRLHDSEHNEIGVYSKGNLSITEGDKIRVTGIFKKEKRAIFMKFRNVLKAKQVEEKG